MLFGTTWPAIRMQILRCSKGPTNRIGRDADVSCYEGLSPVAEVACPPASPTSRVEDSQLKGAEVVRLSNRQSTLHPGVSCLDTQWGRSTSHRVLKLLHASCRAMPLAAELSGRGVRTRRVAGLPDDLQVIVHTRRVVAICGKREAMLPHRSGSCLFVSAVRV